MNIIFKLVFVIACLGLVFQSVISEPLPSQILTATDDMLYDASRGEALTTSLNADAAWDTSAIIGAGYDSALVVSDFLFNNYLLRAVVIYTDEDVQIILDGDGINCKYPNADSLAGYLRADHSITLEFTDIDTIKVVADSTNTSVDVWVLASRIKSLAP